MSKKKNFIYFVDVSCVQKAHTSSVIPKLNEITKVTANSNTSRTTNSPCCKGARCKRNVNGCTEPIFDNKINESTRYSASLKK